MSITTDHGTTVSLERRGEDTLVVLSSAEGPTDEAGRLVYGGTGFQPAPFAAFGMRPDVLRAIADLIDSQN